MYANKLGRFGSPDPVVLRDVVGPQAWNKYGYVLNNPLSLTDPTGLLQCPPVCSDADLKKFSNSSSGSGDVGASISAIISVGSGFQIDGNGYYPYVIFGYNLGAPGINIAMTGSKSPVTPGFSSQAQVSGLLVVAGSSKDQDGNYSESVGGMVFTGPSSAIPSVSQGGVVVLDLPTMSDAFQRLRMLSAIMAENSRRHRAANPIRMCLGTICGGPDPNRRISRSNRSPAELDVIQRQEKRFDSLLYLVAPTFGIKRGAVGRLTKICDENGENCEAQ